MRNNFLQTALLLALCLAIAPGVFATVLQADTVVVSDDVVNITTTHNSYSIHLFSLATQGAHMPELIVAFEEEDFLIIRDAKVATVNASHEHNFFSIHGSVTILSDECEDNKTFVAALGECFPQNTEFFHEPEGEVLFVASATPGSQEAPLETINLRFGDGSDGYLLECPSDNCVFEEGAWLLTQEHNYLLYDQDLYLEEFEVVARARYADGEEQSFSQTIVVCFDEGGCGLNPEAIIEQAGDDTVLVALEEFFDGVVSFFRQLFRR